MPLNIHVSNLCVFLMPAIRLCILNACHLYELRETAGLKAQQNIASGQAVRKGIN